MYNLNIKNDLAPENLRDAVNVLNDSDNVFMTQIGHN